MSFQNNQENTDPILTYPRIGSENITVLDEQGFYFYTLPAEPPNNPEEDSVILIQPDGTSKLENVSSLSLVKSCFQANFNNIAPVIYYNNRNAILGYDTVNISFSKDITIAEPEFPSAPELSFNIPITGKYFFSLNFVVDNTLMDQARATFFCKKRQIPDPVPLSPAFFMVRDFLFNGPITFTGVIDAIAGDIFSFYIRTSATPTPTGNITIYETKSLTMYAI